MIRLQRYVGLSISMVLLLSVVAACGEGPMETPTVTTPTQEPSFESPLVTAFDSPLSSPDSPSGRILFHSDMSGDFDLYVVNADGSDLQKLTDAAGDDVEAVWSPDASQIAFSSKRDGNHEIYVMDADGSNPRRLTDNAATDWGPTWAREGTEIVFASDRNGEMQLFVMNVDGSEERELGPADLTAGWAPDWSPTRDEIVFVSDRAGESNLYLLQLETRNVTQLTFSEFAAERPSWSPDGERIVYMAAKASRGVFDPDEICIISRLGDEQHQLTDNLVGDITPDWSPDAKWIVFSSIREAGWNLFVMPVSGEKDGLMEVTDNAGWNKGPSWGP